MPYALFYDYFPEIAKSETRAITIFEDSEFDLPPGNYALFREKIDAGSNPAHKNRNKRQKNKKS
jgi:hypothetical protein